MRYAIVLSPEALETLHQLRGALRTRVRTSIERHLRHDPTQVSRSRIKRLRGLSRPQYRLRIDETRVFYDVTGTTVQVLAIVTKAQAQAWLESKATPSEGGGAGQDQG